MIVAAACQRCPTLVVERGQAPALPAACPSCGTPFAGGARSERPDDAAVAYALRAGERAFLGLQGDLDLLVRDELLATVEGLLDPPPAALLIDLLEVTFADSTAVATVVRAHRLLSGTGGRLACAIAEGGTTRRVFEVAGVDRHVPLHGTRDAAVRALG